MASVLLATDGSEYARRAAEHAIDLARERDATLHVLAVVDRRSLEEPALSSEELMTMLVEDHCRDEIEAVSSMTREAGVPMEWDSRHGVPHEVIAEYADAVDADCVVVGHHGQRAEHCGGVRRRLLERLNREVVVAPPEA